MDTEIEWAHWPGYRGESWNFLRGCSRTIADGAAHSECGDAKGGGCYAERDGGRWCASEGQPYHGLVRLTGKGPRWTGKVLFVEHKLLDPIRAHAPRCYFVASVSDPFHANVPDEWRDRGFAVMALAPRHLYVLLTKHGADNGSLRRYLLDPETPERIACAVERIAATTRTVRPANAASVAAGLRSRALWPIPRLILGVSAGLQRSLDLRVPELLAVPAWMRTISIEPLLESVDVRPWIHKTEPVRCQIHPDVPWCLGAMCTCDGENPIGWILVGGESGNRARPCDLQWINSVIRQCQSAHIPCFTKQLGLRPIYLPSQWPEEVPEAERHNATPMPWPLSAKDRKGHDVSMWPEPLRVRQFPTEPCNA